MYKYLLISICIGMTVCCIVAVCTLLLTPPLQERGGILCCNVHVHVCSCVETSSFLWCLVNEQPE